VLLHGNIFFLTFSEAEFIKTSSEYVEASEPYALEIYERPLTGAEKYI